MPTLPANDAELLRQMRNSNAHAFAALYRRHQGPLFRFAVLRCGSPASAAEVVQELFLGLLSNRFAYDPLRGPLLHFLFGVARLLILKLEASIYRRLPLPEADEAFDEAAPAVESTVQITVAPGSEISMAGLGPRLAVKNVPYVLDIVKERQQILGDGNQISQRSIARGYRDKAGRTREESLDDTGDVRLIVVKDPEAGVQWMLNPRSKTATKMTMPGRFAMMLRPDRDVGAGVGARNTSVLTQLNSSLSVPLPT